MRLGLAESQDGSLTSEQFEPQSMMPVPEYMEASYQKCLDSFKEDYMQRITGILTTLQLGTEPAVLAKKHPEFANDPTGLKILTALSLEGTEFASAVLSRDGRLTRERREYFDGARRYHQEKLQEIADAGIDIYHPTDEQLKRRVMPYIESIRRDAPILTELVGELDRNHRGTYETLMGFLGKRLEIRRLPRLILKHETKNNERFTENGTFSYNDGTLMIVTRDGQRESAVLNVMSHELWHTHQHEWADFRHSKVYDENRRNYIRAADDYDGYRKQLFEAEAFLFGDAVEDVYRLDHAKGGLSRYALKIEKGKR